VITKYGHSDPRLQGETWRVLECGHPLPDENSLAAGATLLEYLDSLPDGLPLLFLLSGGASALVEALPEGLDLTALERVNNWLLGSGLAIGEMNTVRKRLSRIKGGRLARHLRGRRCLQLLISDVPGDDPATIGSAPLYPATEGALPENLPDWLMHLLEGSETAPVAADSVFDTIETQVIASNDQARHAAAQAAAAMGLTVTDYPGHFQGRVEQLATKFVAELSTSAPGLHLWGGESSVVLPPGPGRGGRNQHLALAAACLLAGRERCLLLAAGTDGSDGPTEEAGALVDGMTVKRGEEEGMSAEKALLEADSGRFLEASGDLIETGPTGSNVMDLVIAWSWDED
jgi:hydroxypyruvate reductase